MAPLLKLPWTQAKYTKQGAILYTDRMHQGTIFKICKMHWGAIWAVQGSLSRGAILGLDNIGWSDVMYEA